jgi:hypothetical protein
MPVDTPSASDQVLELLKQPFWRHYDFWIGLVIGLAGLLFSILAFIEAKKAKKAANAAARTVKSQTVAIELTEIVLKLDKIKPDIRFSEARDLIAEISRRFHRATSPFSGDPGLSQTIKTNVEALRQVRESLKTVRPTDPAKEGEVPLAVYNAIEEACSQISSSVADLIGLFEREAIDFGDDDDNP